MAKVRESVQVQVPVQAAYNQWTRFGEFSQIMRDVQEVRQVDDRHLHWRMHVWGKDIEWDSEITRQIPDTLIEWRNVGGPEHGGVVQFRSLSHDETEVTLAIDYEPDGFIGSADSAARLVEQRVRQELDDFKDYLEQRVHDPLAWRDGVDGQE